MPTVGGDIELMPVADAAVWAAGRRLTGTLTVRRRNIETSFTLRAGYCVQASSSDPREYLGQHLINFSHIDEEQLQQAFDTQKETRVPLGRVLVMVDAITPEQLQRVLTFKTREGLLEVLCWTEGHWRLSLEVDEDSALDCEHPVDLREVASEATARQQMWGEIRRVFPSDATRVAVLVDSLTVESSFDRRLLQLMQTGRSVGEAALELRAMDFQTYARLYDLASRHLVRPLLTSTQVRLEQLTPQALASSGASIVTGPLGQPMLIARAATPAQAFCVPWTSTETTGPAAFSFAAFTAPVVPTTTATTAPPPAAPLSPFAVPAAFAVSPPLPAFPSAIEAVSIAPELKPTPQLPSSVLPNPFASVPRSEKTTPRALSSVRAAPPRAPVIAAAEDDFSDIAFDDDVNVGYAATDLAIDVPITDHAVNVVTDDAVSDDHVDIEFEDDEPTLGLAPFPSAPPAPLSSSRLPSRLIPRAPTPVGSYFGAGTYMMVKPERGADLPGVKIPADAENPPQALRLALAGRNWSEAMLLSQRILEHDPLDSEAIAAFRVADAQLRRIEKQGGAGTEADFGRVPTLAMARDEVALAHLTSKERYVLSRVDGRRSLEQIAAVSPIQRQELMRIVDSFVQRGVLKY